MTYYLNRNFLIGYYILNLNYKATICFVQPIACLGRIPLNALPSTTHLLYKALLYCLHGQSFGRIPIV